MFIEGAHDSTRVVAIAACFAYKSLGCRKSCHTQDAIKYPHAKPHETSRDSRIDQYHVDLL